MVNLGQQSNNHSLEVAIPDFHEVVVAMDEMIVDCATLTLVVQKINNEVPPALRTNN